MEANGKPVYCQNSLIIHYLMCLLGISYQKARIRNIVKDYDSYPKLSVKNLTDVLKRLGIDSSAIKTKPETIKRIQTPFIVYFGNGEINKYFVVVKWIVENKISYYSADEGEVIEDFKYFVEKWTGVVVLVSAENYDNSIKGENDYELELAKEYKQNNVKVIPNFLSEEECKLLIEYTENLGGYSNSRIVGKTGEAIIDYTRTSHSVNLPSDALPLFAIIRNRVTNFLGVPECYIEGLQCVRYSGGQHFAPHLDSNERLNRKHTMLVYLNDEFTGGETYFPELLLKILPVKGSALYFQNEDNVGNSIPFSVHAGLRLKTGVKYACNIWVKDRIA